MCLKFAQVYPQINGAFSHDGYNVYLHLLHLARAMDMLVRVLITVLLRSPVGCGTLAYNLKQKHEFL